MRAARLKTVSVAAGLFFWGSFSNVCPDDFPASLENINDFVYQLQEIDLDAIGKTGFGLAVIDYSSDGSDEGAYTAAEIHALKSSPGGKKIVLSYLSIGEAEEYRSYWQDGWKPGNPSWLDLPNPKWRENYKVRYWDPGWQAVAIEYLDKILDVGFDGIYCDIIDAYEYYEEKGRLTAAQDMVDFVALLREHARTRNPDFLVFVQNAAELAVKIPSYLNVVDGIGQEDIHYGYEEDGKATPGDVTSFMEGNLALFRDAGKLVLTIDYPFSNSEDMPHFDEATRSKILSAYERSKANGFIPYCTVRNLNHLTINPGYDPSTFEKAAPPEAPREFVLLASYPNPFNGGTMIPFVPANPGEVSLTVFDQSGRVIAVPFRGHARMGLNECRWDGRDWNGFEAASGVYLARVQGEGMQSVRKLLLIR